MKSNQSSHNHKIDEIKKCTQGRQNGKVCKFKKEMISIRRKRSPLKEKKLQYVKPMSTWHDCNTNNAVLLEEGRDVG
jgi:hypothetical protein